MEFDFSSFFSEFEIKRIEIFELNSRVYHYEMGY